MSYELRNDSVIQEHLRAICERLEAYFPAEATNGAGVDAVARAKMLALGELLLSIELAGRGRDEPAQAECPTCGKLAKRKERRPREVITVMGPVSYSRAIYRCNDCKQEFAPLDREFGLLEGCKESRALRELLAFCYAGEPTEAVRQNVEKMLCFTLSHSTVHRAVQVEGARALQRLELEAQSAAQPEALDPVRVPWAQPSTGLRQGKVGLAQFDGYMNLRCDLPADESEVAETDADADADADLETDDDPLEEKPRNKGKGRWSEARIALFSDLAARVQKPPSDEEIQRAASEGREPRGRDTLTRKSYVASPRSLEEFKQRVWAEALRWQFHTAETLVVLGDGAPWIWNTYEELFGHIEGLDLVEILDWQHVLKHLRAVAKHVYGKKKGRAEQAVKRWRKRLWEHGDAEHLSKLFAALAEKIRPRDEKAAAKVQRESRYFARHAHRCRYPQFRAKTYPVSSGAVEGACNTFGQRRCKLPGARWSLGGLDVVLALRMYRLNDRWHELHPDAAIPRPIPLDTKAA